MNRILASLVLWASVGIAAFAQQLTVTGKVTDGHDQRGDYRRGWKIYHQSQIQ